MKSLYKIYLISSLIIAGLLFANADFNDDMELECTSFPCVPSAPSVSIPAPTYQGTMCSDGYLDIDHEDRNCPPRLPSCPTGSYREAGSLECVGGYNNTDEPVYTPSPVYTPTAPTAPRPPSSQPIVWTIGYGVYSNPTPRPSAPYVNTNWGSVSGPSGSAPAPIYRPVTPNTPVVSTPQTPYVPTNWGTVSGPSGSAPAPIYRPVTPNTPVVSTPQTPYVPTNWGGTSGPAPTYNPQCQQYYTLQNGQCVQTQKQCQNGQIIGAASTCYKSCPGGNQVPESYSCPVFYNPSVITTITTDTNKTSARCNAVARITNSQNYNGYFEYGTSQNLGQVTNQGNIGSAESVSYSNVISGLSPNTTYYCRAVITNANGTYKGEIQQFRTKGDEYKYVPPAIQKVTTVVKQETITKIVKGKTVVTKLLVKVPEKKIVVCQDVEGNKTNLVEGEKFVDIELIKSGSSYAGEIIDYKFLYKNKSNINLKNSYIKISVPKEYEYIGTLGKVDGSDVILNIGDIKANESKDYTFKFKIKDDVKVNTSVVSSGYIYYEMLDKNGDDVSDENSTYVVSTITDKNVNSIGANNKNNQDTQNSGFSYLFKWLASILLFIILIILGRTIYKNILHKKYKNKVLNAHH